MAGNRNLGPTPDALELGEDLRRVVGQFVRGVRLKADTPTSSQSETLALLDREGALSVASLAARRHVRHQSMRLVVDQLEAKGLVVRMENPADGRSQLVCLSEPGRLALSRSREARSLEIAALIDERLSDEDRRVVRAAIAVIERLL
ncbi:MAG: hypothetical protein H6Q99_4205 [Proteobacteria bacterium]|nr:hypothetical protein [Pseudomonadota bacterium]